MNESAGCVLAPETLALAELYLESDAIRETLVECDFGLPPAGTMSPPRLYALNVMAIARDAPLRLRPDERLAGAATFREAARHACPGGRFPGTSHTTLGFDKALRLGMRGLADEIAASRNRPGRTAEELECLDAMRASLEAMRLWCGRYREAALAAVAAGGDPAGFLAGVARMLERVPEAPPGNFREAVQALQLFYAFQRLCGNWPGLGRLDLLLGPYLDADLAAGAITLDEARELLACFWIKGVEWKGVQYGSGDAQHYQNVILGGVDAAGREVCNRVTRLILEVAALLHISDFPIAVRVNAATPEEIMELIAVNQRLGGGVVSIYNEPVVLKALERAGWSPAEAREFTNDGCWEVIMPGRTAFTYRPFDALEIFQEVWFGGEAFADFEALYSAWRAALVRKIAGWKRELGGAFRGGVIAPCLSLLVDDCVARARDYHDRGARYTVAAIHAGGLPDVANSLTAINEAVWLRGGVAREALAAAMRRDWSGEGDEALRRRMERITLYGNGDAAADAMLRRVVADYARIVRETPDPPGVMCPAGISTFGRELAYAPDRAATAFGRRARAVLAPNLAPTPGSDRAGMGAVIRGYCGVDFTAIPNGCPLDLKLHPELAAGDAGLRRLIALNRNFVELGGFYLQVDVVDAATLRDAQRRPERYPNLSVRISGWSARFTTLDRDWQELVIARTEHRSS